MKHPSFAGVHDGATRHFRDTSLHRRRLSPDDGFNLRGGLLPGSRSASSDRPSSATRLYSVETDGSLRPFSICESRLAETPTRRASSRRLSPLVCRAVRMRSRAVGPITGGLLPQRPQRAAGLLPCRKGTYLRRLTQMSTIPPSIIMTCPVM